MYEDESSECSHYFRRDRPFAWECIVHSFVTHISKIRLYFGFLLVTLSLSLAIFLESLKKAEPVFLKNFEIQNMKLNKKTNLEKSETEYEPEENQKSMSQNNSYESKHHSEINTNTGSQIKTYDYDKGNHNYHTSQISGSKSDPDEIVPNPDPYRGFKHRKRLFEPKVQDSDLKQSKIQYDKRFDWNPGPPLGGQALEITGSEQKVITFHNICPTKNASSMETSRVKAWLRPFYEPHIILDSCKSALLKKMCRIKEWLRPFYEPHIIVDSFKSALLNKMCRIKEWLRPFYEPHIIVDFCKLAYLNKVNRFQSRLREKVGPDSDFQYITSIVFKLIKKLGLFILKIYNQDFYIETIKSGVQKQIIPVKSILIDIYNQDYTIEGIKSQAKKQMVHIKSLLVEIYNQDFYIETIKGEAKKTTSYVKSKLLPILKRCLEMYGIFRRQSLRTSFLKCKSYLETKSFLILHEIAALIHHNAHYKLVLTLLYCAVLYGIIIVISRILEVLVDSKPKKPPHSKTRLYPKEPFHSTTILYTHYLASLILLCCTFAFRIVIKILTVLGIIKNYSLLQFLCIFQVFFTMSFVRTCFRKLFCYKDYHIEKDTIDVCMFYISIMCINNHNFEICILTAVGMFYTYTWLKHRSNRVIFVGLLRVALFGLANWETQSLYNNLLLKSLNFYNVLRLCMHLREYSKVDSIYDDVSKKYLTAPDNRWWFMKELYEQNCMLCE